MRLFAEFQVPSTEFALSSTLERMPDLVVEIDRVVATEELLPPYFWVSEADPEVFESVAHHALIANTVRATPLAAEKE